jgi:RecB family exonuclease
VSLRNISYSHLHLLACPYAAFLRYEASVKGPTTKYIALGNAVHHALEEAHKEEGVESFNWNFRKAVPDFQTEFMRIIEDEQVAVGWPEIKKMESEGVEMLEKYDAQVTSGTLSASPMALEVSFKLPFMGTEVIGRIDKVEFIEDTGYVVTDYKTGQSKPTKWSLSHNVQLSTYAWACQEIYGELPAKVIWHHLRTGELLESPRTEQDINDVKLMIENAIKIDELGIRHRIYHDAVCSLCDYRGDMCDNRELEQEALDTIASGQRMLPQIYVKPPRWA